MGSSEDAQESAAIVQRILDGDRNAEAQMVKTYQEGLYTVLRRKAYKGNEDILDDVIQDTWQVVLEKVRDDQLNDPQKLPQFIVKTGINQLLMHLRKSKSSRLILDGNIEEFDDEKDANPLQKLEKLRTGQLLRKLINKLKKPRDREILDAHYLQEHDKESICENHQLDEKHLHRVLHRARARLKEQLEEENDEQ